LTCQSRCILCSNAPCSPDLCWRCLLSCPQLGRQKGEQIHFCFRAGVGRGRARGFHAPRARHRHSFRRNLKKLQDMNREMPDGAARNCETTTPRPGGWPPRLAQPKSCRSTECKSCGSKYGRAHLSSVDKNQPADTACCCLDANRALGFVPFGPVALRSRKSK
jgi:hypothetical protein